MLNLNPAEDLYHEVMAEVHKQRGRDFYYIESFHTLDEEKRIFWFILQRILDDKTKAAVALSKGILQEKYRLWESK